MACHIAVTRLSLTHFRNYEQLQLSLTPAPVILTGHNGAGKTNLLEALSFLIPGRGLRRAKLSELDNAAHTPRKPWVISATVQSPYGEVQIGTSRDPASGEEGDKRLVKIEGTPQKSQNELANYVSVSWLTPAMDQLFNEGGSSRRRFLDRLVYGFDATHASRVNAYEYAMRERNRLLSERSYDSYWVDTLEHKMAETGTAIAIARMQACAHMNEEMQASPHSFPKAHLTLKGVVEDRIERGEKAVAVEQAYVELLKSVRGQDAAAGRTLQGIHRSELQVVHLLKNMEASFCSTGEQKALLLSIILAEARACAHWHGKVPIMLLDEVVAHLDPKRRGELFQEILAIRAQTWMTGTDAALFREIAQNAQFFEVSAAAVKMCEFA